VEILVVGGAGYIGSHMVQFIREWTGHEAVVLDNLAKGHAPAVGDTELVVGDFGDRAAVAALCRTRGIDAVMHFGADSLVGESVQNPAKYYENNVVKGKALVDGMRDAGVQHLIFSSTAAVYGMPARVPIAEDDPTIPINPYGRTKLAFEGLLASYHDAYGLNYTCLRYFNAAGADPAGRIGEDHQPESHLIPIVLQVALGQRPSVAVYGHDYATPDGTCIRDYVHVLDLASAHLLALERLVDGGPSGAYNLGNGQGFSVQEVIAACRAVTGHAIPTTQAERRPGDPDILVAAADRARAELGWQPATPALHDIVATAWTWHKSHPTGFGA
jgi:UDP-glucose 4-epimerase